MATKKQKRVRAAGEDKMGRIELHYASAAGDAEAVRSHLQGGADPNATDDNGWSPLHFAAQAGSEAITRLLLRAGAKVNAQDSNGNTPLSTAAFSSRGEGELIELLRASGADPLLENSYGVSAVSLARSIANYNVAQHFKDLP
jgi:ankyrin repeat protein